MRQSDYFQTIPRHPSVSAPIVITCRQIDEVFEYWEHDMALDEVQTTILERDWSCQDGYITWYCRVSHPYMIPIAPGSPPRPAHEVILRTHQSQFNHTDDVLSRCREILDMA